MGEYTAQDWQQVQACCQAYALACQSLDQPSQAMLPLLMAYIPARGIVDAIHEEDPVGEILAFARAIDLAVWLVDNPDEALKRLWG